MNVVIENDNAFGYYLKFFRTTIMNMTQKDFSSFLGIKQPTLSSYESGKIKPTVDVLINISRKCHVSIDWLCGNSEFIGLNSLADLTQLIFNLYETKEIACESVLAPNKISLLLSIDKSDSDIYETYDSIIRYVIKQVESLTHSLYSNMLQKEHYDILKDKLINEYRQLKLSQKELPMTDEHPNIEQIKSYIALQNRKRSKYNQIDYQIDSSPISSISKTEKI